MTQVLIDKKKYVILPIKEYEILQKKAALKSKPEKLFSLEEARAYSRKKINEWAAEYFQQTSENYCIRPR